MERVYYHFKKWEDYKYGFYSNCNGDERELKIQSVIELFTSKSLTECYMRKAIELWNISMDQNLSNKSINRVAYLGQAACCVYNNVPNLVTMEAWKRLTNEDRYRSDLIAIKLIKEWEVNRKLKNTFHHGSRKGINQEYQMKLLFN